MVDPGVLPDGVVLVRTTPVFTDESCPAALRRGHQVADGVWGRLVVSAGHVTYVVEETAARRRLESGDQQVIQPGIVHHVEPSADAGFVVEFHR